MTFEEIQKTIEGMLAVQRQLQESQMQLHERQIELQESQFELRERQLWFQETQEQDRETLRATLQVITEEMNRFIERSNLNERRIEQLIGYSITNESEHLDIEQRFNGSR